MNIPPSSTLDPVVARGAALLRTFAVLYSLIYIACWHSWYADQPARLIGPLAFLAWGGLYAAGCLRYGLRGPLIAVDIALGLGLAISGNLLVPPATVGDGSNWAFLDVGGAALAATWTLGPLLAAAAVLLLDGVYAVAATAVGLTGPAQGSPVKSFTLLLGLSAMFGYTIHVIRRQARAADDRLDTANAERRRIRVERALAKDRREQDRLVHDTVLNTLTGIAWGGVGDGSEDGVLAARRRCERDVDVLAELLVSADGDGRADLAERIRAVVAETADVGLQVDLDLGDRAGARTAAARSNGLVGVGWDGAAAGTWDAAEFAGTADIADIAGTAGTMSPAGGEGLFRVGPPAPELPAGVVLAISAATREALANVSRHARTRQAWVALRYEPAGVRVFVRDEGVGFDPGGVGPRRLGIARSISSRMADIGGTADVTSLPGRGTTVVLGWAAADQDPPRSAR